MIVKSQFYKIEDYFSEVANEIDRLRQQKQDALVEKADRESLKQRTLEMKEFLTTRKREITSYNEQLVRRLIEQITVMMRSLWWNSSQG